MSNHQIMTIYIENGQAEYVRELATKEKKTLSEFIRYHLPNRPQNYEGIKNE